VDVGHQFETREGQQLNALAGVHLEIKPGEFVSLLGPSGCGKTTLLRMVAGLLAPSSGQVLVGGVEVRAPRPDVGLVFQQALLLPWLSVMRNVLLPVDVQGRRIADYQDRALSLIRMVGLGGFEKRLPNELSGGFVPRLLSPGSPANLVRIASGFCRRGISCPEKLFAFSCSLLRLFLLLRSRSPLPIS
jgi:NitT/TauT family transport system ATP-binding protein